MVRQERQVKVRAWAADNAYSLIFLSVMFFVTWVVVGIVGIWLG